MPTSRNMRRGPDDSSLESESLHLLTTRNWIMPAESKESPPRKEHSPGTQQRHPLRPYVEKQPGPEAMLWEQRNCYCLNSLCSFVTAYHKNLARTGQEGEWDPSVNWWKSLDLLTHKDSNLTWYFFRGLVMHTYKAASSAVYTYRLGVHLIFLNCNPWAPDIFIFGHNMLNIKWRISVSQEISLWGNH